MQLSATPRLGSGHGVVTCYINGGGLETCNESTRGLAQPGSCRTARISSGFSVVVDSKPGILGLKLLLWRCSGKLRGY